MSYFDYLPPTPPRDEQHRALVEEARKRRQRMEEIKWMTVHGQHAKASSLWTEMFNDL